MLLRAGASVDSRDHNGHDAVWWATKYGHRAVVTILQVHANRFCQAVSSYYSVSNTQYPCTRNSVTC